MSDRASRIGLVVFWGACWVGLLSAIAAAAGVSILWAAILGPPALFAAAVAWEAWPFGMAPGLWRGVLVAVTLTASLLGLFWGLFFVVRASVAAVGG